MLNIRTILLSIMLVFLLMLTVTEAVTSGVINPSTNLANGAAIKRTETIDCFSLPSRYSLHAEYVNELNSRVVYTEDGPTGVDGGVKELMTAYRTCSR